MAFCRAVASGMLLQRSVGRSLYGCMGAVPKVSAILVPLAIAAAGEQSHCLRLKGECTFTCLSCLMPHGRAEELCIPLARICINRICTTELESGMAST